MTQHIFNLLCAFIVGLIITFVGFVINKSGLDIQISLTECITTGFFCALVCYIALMPRILKQIKHICCDYDWAEETVLFYNRIPAKYRQSFWLIFGFINLAFLFHTINFMWGNEDWYAIRTAVDHNESISQGAFSAYWLQELLFDGKILPVINNLWAFAGLSLAGVLLAVYWNLPMRATPIVISALLFTVTPYVLSILYFTKTSLGVCWLPAIVLTALLLSERNTKGEISTYLYNIGAVILLTCAFGTYTPVLNFIAVALLGKIFLKTVYSDISIKDIAHRILQSLSNLTAALMIYLFILFLLKETGRLSFSTANTITIGGLIPWQNFTLFIKSAFTQFATPLPFMDIVYKSIYMILVLIGIFTMIFKAPSVNASIRGLITLPFIIFASVLITAFIPNAELHFARSCFFGLSMIYTLMFILTIRLGGTYICRIGYTLAVLLIFMNFVRISYAEKVWKFGWDAETKLAERIITRLEKMPEFNIDRQYQLLQIGEKSLRSKYYKISAYENPNGELLDRAYYPAGKSADAYNFFYQTDFLSGDAEQEALNEPAIKDYLLNKARAWPAKESLFIYGNYIVLILDEKALAQTQKLLNN